ncbi:hypothetical protein GCM10027195_27290 [Comamonas sediminis]
MRLAVTTISCRFLPAVSWPEGSCCACADRATQGSAALTAQAMAEREGNNRERGVQTGRAQRRVVKGEKNMD